jgi:hypothetical protein
MTIPDAFQHEMAIYMKQDGRAVGGLKSQTRAIFKRYDIPGEVRSHIIYQALEQEGVIVYTSSLSVAHKPSISAFAGGSGTGRNRRFP